MARFSFRINIRLNMSLSGSQTVVFAGVILNSYVGNVGS